MQPRQIRTAIGPIATFDVGAGQPLLLMHSEAGPEALAPIVQILSSRRRVIAPVHPGFGSAPPISGVDTVQDLGFLYMDLLDALEVDSFELAGFALGGWIAAELATRFSSGLSALALVSAVGIRLGERDESDIADIFSLDADELAARSFHGGQAPNYSELDPAEVEKIAQNREAAARYAWSPYMHDPKLRSRLHRVGVPSLVVWGGEDGVAPLSYGRALSACLPNSQFELVPKAAHYLEIEQPEAAAAHLLRFFDHHATV